MTSEPVTHEEREQVLEAFIDAVAELGYQEAALTAILERAGLSPREFRKYFADKEEAFISAWYFITERSFGRSLAAFEGASSWRDQMRSLAGAVFGYMKDHPTHARILYVEGLKAGDVGVALLERSVDFYSELIDGGRREMEEPESLTRATAEGIAGAIYEQASIHIARGAADELPGMVPQFMFMAVRPYLGYEAAMEELER
jgi:AcrR family transcriptional regulator